MSRHPFVQLGLVGLLLLVGGCGDDGDDLQVVFVRDQRAGLDASLDDAGTNRAELERALAAVEGPELESMRFLIEEMPRADLRTLTADFLVENVKLAHQAWERAPWRDDVPPEVFRNEILPYASASEPRRPWRKTLFDALMPVVAESKTTREAVVAVNKAAWKHFGIKYSMKRERPDQAPLRTIEIQLGSCTSVAIFLNACCRAVGVPSRIVGISWWPHMPGNHTWVEFLDGGTWHFTGAMEAWEPIDNTWFVKSAARAKKDNPRHAIYAASFQWTGDAFPMHWAEEIPVHGINVTDRYAPGQGGAESR